MFHSQRAQLGNIGVRKRFADCGATKEINELVAAAMETNQSLTFKVFNKRYGCFELIKGKVHYIDTIHKNFRILDENEVIQQVHFNVIVDVYKE